MLWKVIQHVFGYTARLKQAMPEIALHAPVFLTTCALNIGSYVFYRAYWQQAKADGIKEVTFLAPDIIAFACVDAGIQSIFLQHGLLAASILLPPFNCIFTITADEKRYFNKVLPHTPVFIKTKNRLEHCQIKKNTLVLLLPHIMQEQDLVTITQLIEWAHNNALSVIARPTPITTENKIAAYKKTFPSLHFDQLEHSLEHSIEKWSPKLIASWWSTGLATALEYECLPISFCDPAGHYAISNMIYPMEKRVLFWPRDRPLLQEALQSDLLYRNQVDTIKQQL
jgi:hypothetical protein